MTLQVRWLGRLGFTDALALQEEIVAQKSDPTAPDELLLLEHDPVYTIGRSPDRSSLRDAGRLTHPVVETNRGGKATYHGPGQLVGYPIIDLKRRGANLHTYLRALEAIIIETLKQYGINASRRPSLTGVWVGERKIASIGVGVRHWITMHGFALNVCGDLGPFQNITPCGIAGVEMTNLERESRQELSVQECASAAGAVFTSQIDDLLVAPATRMDSTARD